MRRSIPASTLALFFMACGGDAAPEQGPPPVEPAGDDTVEQLRLHHAVDRDAEGYDVRQSAPGPAAQPTATPAAAPAAPATAAVSPPVGVANTVLVSFWSSEKVGWPLAIDGEPVGVLPVKVELSEGQHIVAITTPEGETLSKTRNITVPSPGMGLSIDLGGR